MHTWGREQPCGGRGLSAPHREKGGGPGPAAFVWGTCSGVSSFQSACQALGCGQLPSLPPAQSFVPAFPGLHRSGRCCFWPLRVSFICAPPTCTRGPLIPAGLDPVPRPGSVPTLGPRQSTHSSGRKEVGCSVRGCRRPTGRRGQPVQARGWIADQAPGQDPFPAKAVVGVSYFTEHTALPRPSLSGPAHWPSPPLVPPLH